MDACTHAVHLPERERYIQRHRVRAVVLLLTLWAFGDAFESDNKQLVRTFFMSS